MNKKWRVPARVLNKNIGCEWQLVCWKQLVGATFKFYLWPLQGDPFPLKLTGIQTSPPLWNIEDKPNAFYEWQGVNWPCISSSVHPQEDKIAALIVGLSERPRYHSTYKMEWSLESLHLLLRPNLAPNSRDIETFKDYILTLSQGLKIDSLASLIWRRGFLPDKMFSNAQFGAVKA